MGRTIKLTIIALLLIILAAIVVALNRTGQTKEHENFTSSYTNATTTDILITRPEPGSTVTSPLTVTGKARGSWYFEASFPLLLVDWDGKIIAEGHAEAQGNWMTNELVPFTGTLTFTNPNTEVNNKGALIVRKDNPSGLPEHDAAVEIPIFYTK